MSGVALITGASGALGRACAVALAEAGWCVAGAARGEPRDPVAGADHFVRMDVRDSDSVRGGLACLGERTGKPVTLLVHAAGVTRDALVARQDLADWDEVQAVHVKGAWLCAKACWAGMVAAGGGHVVLVGSHAARLGGEGQCAYAAAKAGVIALGQSLAAEGAADRILVNVACPGVLRSPMTEALDGERRRRLLEACLTSRFNEPEEVATFVAALASSRQISGQVFYFDSRRLAWT